MKNILLKLILLNAIIFLPFFAQTLFACQCFGVATPYEAFKAAQAVFTGKVISVLDESGKEVVKKSLSDPGERYQRENGVRFYRFAVQQWFKGTKTSEITLSFDLNMCQSGFDAGEKFLVYASESEGKLSTYTFCSRTKNLESAQQQDIPFLDDLLKGVSEPRIYGTVRLTDKDLVTSSFRSKNLEGIKIIAQRNKSQYITFSDKNGLYRFNELPDGMYRVYPDLPNKYGYEADWDTLTEINLQPNREIYQREYDKFWGSNAYSNLQLRWNNQISGKILDAEGKYLTHASVKLIPVNQIDKINDKPFLYNERFVDYLSVENQGSNVRKYNMTGSTPGKYILAVEIFAPFSSGRERLRMYYPQLFTPQAAEIINIGEFDQRNTDIKLPAEYVAHDIEGSLLWKSGDPIKDGNISIEKKENSNDQDNIIYDSQYVTDGKFKLQGFENAEYWIHAKIYNETIKPVKIKVGKSNPPMKIVLSLLTRSLKIEN